MDVDWNLDMNNRRNNMKNEFLELKRAENYSPYNPANIRFEGANFTTVSEKDGDLIFSVDCDNIIIKITFKGTTPFYLYSEQGIRMTTWSTVQKKYNDNDYFKKSPLFIVENSVLSTMMDIESCGFYSDSDIKHYCIVTEQDVVDILSASAPEFDIVEL